MTGLGGSANGDSMSVIGGPMLPMAGPPAVPGEGEVRPEGGDGVVTASSSTTPADGADGDGPRFPPIYHRNRREMIQVGVSVCACVRVAPGGGGGGDFG